MTTVRDTAEHAAARAAVARRHQTPSAPMMLVADPDPDLRREVADRWSGQHVTVIQCGDGASALLETGVLQPELLLLAADLPVLDGLSVLRTVRRRMTLPVVFGLAGGQGALSASAMAAGADECIRRPYGPRDMRRLLRLVSHSDHPRGHQLRYGTLTLDEAALTVEVGGSGPIQLTLLEFRLLRLLMRDAGRIVPRERIISQLWGPRAPRSNTLSVHIQRLRRRLGDDPQRPRTIQTVRGVGYRLVPPDGGERR
ncbi:response regulator transcription factor [Streptomyces sp. TR06-5]|uniref:response regulator transcription factor n=1 Tax=Streptomyces sp. TR06-5 TaxID=3385976 RepID=UPI00399F66FF